MPTHKGPRTGTAVLLGTVLGIYSCSIPFYWMDEWMNGQDRVKSSRTILLATTRGQCPTTNFRTFGRPEVLGPPSHPMTERGGQTAEAIPQASSPGQEEAAGAGLAHTQHADAQHEGVHSIGHDSRPPPGRAGRGHHLFRLSFLTFHLQRDLAVSSSYSPPVTYLPVPWRASILLISVTMYRALTLC